MEYKLVDRKASERLPSSLKQRAKDPEAFRKSYHGVAHVTDVVKEEILHRLNAKLVPSDSSFTLPGWAERHARDIGYIKAMKEVLELLP